ncbi:hypothetical protein R1sor_005321 [Riccia sorocarpa]|uniref:Dimethylargininase n=1 Tax=Riccia sorocarpa TaxID=122646 RepID=A0ABD3HNK8_9MARC
MFTFDESGANIKITYKYLISIHLSLGTVDHHMQNRRTPDALFDFIGAKNHSKFTSGALLRLHDSEGVGCLSPSKSYSGKMMPLKRAVAALRWRNVSEQGQQLFFSTAESTGMSMKRSMPRAAIVRQVPDTFADALAMEEPSAPVNVSLARQQHAAYVRVLKELVPEVIVLPADKAYPDCPFVEDTAVVIGSRALITRPGAKSRQGEELMVKEALQRLGIETLDTEAPARIDGGDVLFESGILFVGQSTRTNEEGLKALTSAFPDVQVVPVPVPKSLHLKTVLSSIATGVLAVEESVEGRNMFACIQKAAPFLKSVPISPAGAANTVLLGCTVIYPSGYGRNFDSTYKQYADRTIPVNISEFHKVDGGLTCLSILVP